MREQLAKKSKVTVMVKIQNQSQETKTTKPTNKENKQPT